jgi:hypothetical protein
MQHTRGGIKITTGFWSGNLRVGDSFEDQSIKQRITLKYTSKERDQMASN